MTIYEIKNLLSNFNDETKLFMPSSRGGVIEVLSLRKAFLIHGGDYSFPERYYTTNKVKEGDAYANLDAIHPGEIELAQKYIEGIILGYSLK